MSLVGKIGNLREKLIIVNERADLYPKRIAIVNLLTLLTHL